MDIFTAGLLYFTSFFTLINPLGIMPVFISMTSDLEDSQRKRIAGKAVITAFIILTAFAFSGQILFDFFNISVHSFRMAGGIIFFLVGYDMLQARIGKTKVDSTEINTYVTDISITPLAIPMICGPGAITNAIVLMEDSDTIALKITLIVSISLTIFVTYIVLWSSSRIIKILGETGNKVLMRLMGLIVMVIAIEFFFAGLKPVLQDILGK
ncbi:MAG: antibiotic resistance protein MarC [Bacteroidia bacterium]|nr:MAG: antibiotic resistance protein MarC [Bacteroidia bacterium]PIE86539.1 MAG: antibiotic resistance protein MarC [Bacteroidia bacterium]